MSRVLDTNLWTDLKWKREIKDISKRYFWLYLLSCPSSRMSGIFYLPIDEMQVHTRLSEEEIEESLKFFQEKGYIYYNYNTEEILIYNYPKYNVNKLGKPIIDCLTKDLSLVKDLNLIKSMVDYITKYIELRPNDKKINILNTILPTYQQAILPLTKKEGKEKEGIGDSNKVSSNTKGLHINKHKHSDTIHDTGCVSLNDKDYNSWEELLNDYD